MSETVGSFFLSFFFSQKRNGLDETSSAVTNMSWYLPHSIIFPTLICLTIFVPFNRKQYFEATNNCTRRFTRHNLFDANWNTLVKRRGCFFTNKINSLTKTFSADANTSQYLPHPTPLLIYDRRSPPWYKFLSLPSLPLSLKSKMAANIFVAIYWALARQDYACSAGSVRPLFLDGSKRRRSWFCFTDEFWKKLRVTYIKKKIQISPLTYKVSGESWGFHEMKEEILGSRIFQEANHAPHWVTRSCFLKFYASQINLALITLHV